ncbi:MAG: carbohydrate kinase family protein [Armatimonadota bacterium]|nr:carbohydrate kinase family protein [Armatimonadota bacterium]
MRPEAWDESRDFDVLVVGDLNIDLILSGIPRIPAYGEEVLASALTRRLGGSAANFAVCCGRLGLKVAFVARVGRDDFGDFLVGELERWGVTGDFVARDPERATGITVSLSSPEDRAFVTYVGTIDSLRGDDVPRSLLGRAGHMHVGSYFLQTKLQPGLPEVADAAHDEGLSVSLDTGYDPAEDWDGGLLALLERVDLFLPNEIEAQAITETRSVQAAFAALCSMADVVALKLGAEGAIACANEETVRLPAFAVETEDTTCCGDAFNAGFLAALMAGLSLEECVARGNAAGGLMASVVGNDAGVLSPQAVEELVSGMGAPGSGGGHG